MKKTLLLILLFTTSHVVNAQEDTTYPSSEWDYAKEILMHTLGEELFDSIIHPYATSNSK